MAGECLQGQLLGSCLVDSVATFKAIADLLDVPRSCLRLEQLFSTASSGWSNVRAFHQSCDGKGPTLVLIQGSDGNCYGGYTSVSWASSGGYQDDEQAFLFRLKPPGSTHPSRKEMFRARAKGSSALFCDSNHGPTFGGGNDLLTFTRHGLIFTMKSRTYPIKDGTALIDSKIPHTAVNYALEVLQIVVDNALQLDSAFTPGLEWSQQVRQLQQICTSGEQ